MNQNPVEVVKEFFPEISDNQALNVLWCCTKWPDIIWPIGDNLRIHLRAFSDISMGDPVLACKIAQGHIEKRIKNPQMLFFYTNLDYAVVMRKRIEDRSYLLWLNEAGGEPVPDHQSIEYWRRAQRAVLEEIRRTFESEIA